MRGVRVSCMELCNWLGTNKNGCGRDMEDGNGGTMMIFFDIYPHLNVTYLPAQCTCCARFWGVEGRCVKEGQRDRWGFPTRKQKARAYQHNQQCREVRRRPANQRTPEIGKSLQTTPPRRPHLYSRLSFHRRHTNSTAVADLKPPATTRAYSMHYSPHHPPKSKRRFSAIINHQSSSEPVRKRFAVSKFTNVRVQLR